MNRQRLLLVTLGLAATAAGYFAVARVGRQSDGSYLIPTGQRLTPAGKHLEVADRPLGMTLSPDGKTLAVVTGSNFARRALHLFDIAARREKQQLEIGDSFVGVAFSPDGQRIYVGGGTRHEVKIFEQAGGEFRETAGVPVPGGAPSGLSLNAKGDRLYVALNLKRAVAVIDTEARRVLAEVETGAYPYTTLATADRVYVSNWGGRFPREGDEYDDLYRVVLDPKTGIPNTGTVSVIDPAANRKLRDIEAGLHPSALALRPGTSLLYVANANSDTVTVIDTKTDKVVDTIPVRLYQRAPLGSSPHALAFSPNGAILYVANGTNNAVAVVDLKTNKIRGFIPTGWFPAAVAAEPQGKQLIIASGYGFGSIAPAARSGTGRSYRDRAGVVSFLDLPTPDELARYTRQVMDNNRAQEGPARPASASHPIPMAAGRNTPIKYVFYIIKENRTYDQVFGDLPQGNGDPSLVQFGRDVTPNHHALAEQFVLLDNFYTPGDQSALGHIWSTMAWASDWAHKYSNARNDGNPMKFAPTGHLWDHARRHGKTVRVYGEQMRHQLSKSDATFLEIYEDWKSGANRITTKIVSKNPTFRGVAAPDFPGYDLRIPDQRRADVFLREFREFEQNGNLPHLSILLIGNDHTSGTREGFPTPRASVADNDLALGRIVEAISKSRYWKESAIFVVEDDSQAGLDHVDGHRTVALVVSPYTKRKFVDSTFYTTINMVRTIEQILGLPPMSQFDHSADPMFSSFTAQADFTPYAVLQNQIALNEMNPAIRALRGLQRELALASMRMDFEDPDEAPEQLLNRVIWHSVKGYDRPYPVLRPAAK
jgi:YVTN family beta-propeller protein